MICPITKWYILVITWAPVVCLIYVYTLGPWGLQPLYFGCIYQAKLLLPRVTAIIYCTYCVVAICFVSVCIFIITYISLNFIVNCMKLTNFNNGMINCSLGDDGVPSYEDTCNFTCNTGYELTGSDTRTCQSDGSWSGSDTTCERGVCLCIATSY